MLYRNLRKYLDRPVNRVGVLYRKVLKSYVDQQIEFAEMERIETIAIELKKTPTARDIRDGLRQLREVYQVDAIWVLNDSAMFLEPDIIAKGWIEGLSTEPLPVVVGVPNLVQVGNRLGNRRQRSAAV